MAILAGRERETETETDRDRDRERERQRQRDRERVPASDLDVVPKVSLHVRIVCFRFNAIGWLREREK